MGGPRASARAALAQARQPAGPTARRGPRTERRWSTATGLAPSEPAGPAQMLLGQRRAVATGPAPGEHADLADVVVAAHVSPRVDLPALRPASTKTLQILLLLRTSHPKWIYTTHKLHLKFRVCSFFWLYAQRVCRPCGRAILGHPPRLERSTRLLKQSGRRVFAVSSAEPPLSVSDMFPNSVVACTRCHKTCETPSAANGH